MHVDLTLHARFPGIFQAIENRFFHAPAVHTLLHYLA
jgi:hypothetical protein